ncbi:MAG: hypothetical protein U0457_10900 [Candidatus Sericytochromatia bacterium]
MSGGTLSFSQTPVGSTFGGNVKTASQKALKSADKTQEVFDVSSQGVKTAKSVVSNGNTAIETTSKVKKIAQGTFEPAEASGKIDKIKNAVMESKTVKNVATFLTENKVVQFVEKSSIGRLVIANHDKLASGLSKGLTVLGVAGGSLQIGKGIYQIAKGDTYDGGWNVVKGGALVTSAVVSGPIGIAVYAGAEIAHYGDKATKEFGWFKDAKGENESAVQHVGTKVKQTYENVSKKDGKVAGVMASSVAAQGQTIIAATSIVAGAAIKGVKTLGEGAEKAGKKAQDYGNKMEAKADENFKKGGVVNTVKATGQVVVAKVSKTVGVALEKTGKALTYVADKAKEGVGKAVAFAEKQVDRLANAVGNTVGKISNGISSAWNSFKSWF